MPIGLIEHTSIIAAIWEKIKCPCASSKTGTRHKKRGYKTLCIFNSSEFYTKEGAEVLENATMLFAFVFLSRQQIKPLCPVETFDTPYSGVFGYCPRVRNIRIFILLDNGE